MPSAPGQKGNKPSKQLAAIDQLLIAGIKHGPAKKRDAINRVLELVPEMDPWRLLAAHPRVAEDCRTCGSSRSATQPGQRSLGKLPQSGGQPSRPWTPADDDRLLNLAGYEPVKRIAQRLDRSVRAVRFRIAALGMSARVTDGWSLRASVEDVPRQTLQAAAISSETAY